MGRRPNQLVVEFFQRGKKLEDASNRYEHTCKRCGEVFPKGRIDSLLGHLLRRCPNVTQLDRENVFFYMQSAPNKPSMPISQKGNQGGNTLTPQQTLAGALDQGQPPFLQQGHEMQMQPEMPAGQFQQQSALETLAEVSRRHLDFSSQRGQFTDGQERGGDDQGRVALAEQALMLQLQQAAANSIPQHLVTDAQNPSSYHYGTDASQAAEQKFDVVPLGASASAPVAQSGLETNKQTDPAPPNDVSAPHLPDHTIDPQLDSVPAQIPTPMVTHIPEANFQPPMEDVMMWNPTSSTGRQTVGTLSAPSERPGPGFGLLQKNSKRTSRGRFTDTRRKEIQEIRKRGACIRCRMLKKPCSDGTPCKTCSNVESARLWMGTCVRTRLAEEFTLWGVGLFQTKVNIEVPAAVQGLPQRALPGRIEARFFAGAELCLSFAVKQYRTTQNAAQCLGHDLDISVPEPGTIWLIDEGEEMGDKIEEYINRVAHARISEERSGFVMATMQRAQELILSEQAEQIKPNGEHASRSCYNLQSELLKNAVELWVETCILTASERLELDIYYRPDKKPQNLPEPVDWTTADSASSKIIGRQSPSRSLIKSQLLAATESRCSKLARVVINELERRLLQRQQVSRFSTFTSAIVLLNCIERLTGYFRAFDEEAGTDATNLNAVYGSYLSNWPLDEPPRRLWPRGEHFASLLVMLLRIRALLPITRENPDGTLSTIQDYTLPANFHGQITKDRSDEQAKAAAEWLNSLKLRVADLKLKRYGPLPTRDEGVEAWDMRFISQVLLPESMA